MQQRTTLQEVDDIHPNHAYGARVEWIMERDPTSTVFYPFGKKKKNQRSQILQILHLIRIDDSRISDLSGPLRHMGNNPRGSSASGASALFNSGRALLNKRSVFRLPQTANLNDNCQKIHQDKSHSVMFRFEHAHIYAIQRTQRRAIRLHSVRRIDSIASAHISGFCCTTQKKKNIIRTVH